jgi:C-terminal processing protease CtpA/Prc
VAKWLTPNERAIHKIGLTPEVYVTMTEEDYNNKLDPQLDAAIQTLMALLARTPIPTSMPTPIPTP